MVSVFEMVIWSPDKYAPPQSTLVSPNLNTNRNVRAKWNNLKKTCLIVVAK